MDLLLDTHILLWWLDDNPMLPDRYSNAIMDKDNICFISAASIWEISIKRALGKLEIPSSYINELKTQGFLEIPITWEHSRSVQDLPLHHRDPFDRILIAQSRIENLKLLTVDSNISLYNVSIF